MQRYKFSSYMKACLRNGKEGKMGKINDKMENTTSGWFFLSLFQNDIPMVSRKKEISCFTHKATPHPGLLHLCRTYLHFLKT